MTDRAPPAAPNWLVATLPVMLGIVFLALLGWRFTRPGPAWTRPPEAARQSISSPSPATTPPHPSLPSLTTAPARGRPPRPIAMPVAGVDASALRDNFDEARGGERHHEALDILAPRGTPVVAVDDGVVRKLFTSVRGGLTVYQYDPDSTYCYYYAHLDNYADGLHESQPLRRGDLVGFVGTTGNAPKNTPHLHFAVYLLDAEKRWWTGTPVNAYPLLVGR